MRYGSCTIAHNLYLHMAPAGTNERLLHEHKPRSALPDAPPEGVLYLVYGMRQADASSATAVKGFDDYRKPICLGERSYVVSGCYMGPGCDGHTQRRRELPRTHLVRSNLEDLNRGPYKSDGLGIRLGISRIAAKERGKFGALAEESVTGVDVCAVSSARARNVSYSSLNRGEIPAYRRAISAMCSGSIYRAGESKRTASPAYDA